MVCDLKQSRALKPRKAFANQLAGTLDQLNARHRPHLHAPFGQQKGIDEFAAFLKPAAPVGRILTDLWMGLHPYPVRIALAVGDAQHLGPSSQPVVTGFDGPAFHEAADRLSGLHRDGKLLGLPRSRDPSDRALESFGNLLHFTILSWTPRQLTLFRELDLGLSQKEIASRFGVSQPTVSATLRRLNAKFMRGAIVEWTAALSAAGRKLSA